MSDLPDVIRVKKTYRPSSPDDLYVVPDGCGGEKFVRLETVLDVLQSHYIPGPPDMHAIRDRLEEMKDY